jgi:hypothetical protein
MKVNIAILDPTKVAARFTFEAARPRSTTFSAPFSDRALSSQAASREAHQLFLFPLNLVELGGDMGPNPKFECHKFVKEID